MTALPASSSPDDDLFSVDIEALDVAELPGDAALASLSSGSTVGSASCPASSASTLGTVGCFG
ncbi:thiocillin family RiPP [Rathayibacter sp. VKM Ac-2801]|uniref:thiocillin family RiPP n=1 Tax=Rathayibacter sp. VKM Ac-2801 TaxID=2609255 RepID=UPI00131FEF19|nr:thiocillin family RiPP [Rathayibacter sp. VKM Ac-2801]QHC71256.1 thiocillin family RiPP [Rathayibacter sp. VKM Ac-2801]